MSEAINLRPVRFRVYHQGMGADIGDVLHVPDHWAAAAIDSGIVEAAEPPAPRQLQGHDSPGWVGRQGEEG